MIFDNSPRWYGYFQARLKNKIHQAVLEEFLRQERAGLNNATTVANMLGKTSDEVKQLLGAPGDWTLDTVSDLLYAMGCEPDVKVIKIWSLVNKDE